MIKKNSADVAVSLPIEDVRLLLECAEDEHGGDHTDADCRYCKAVNRLTNLVEKAPANAQVERQP